MKEQQGCRFPPKIEVAHEDAQIARCFPVMAQLRGHLTADEFPRRVRLQQPQGYQLVYLEDGGEIQAVAGFRIGDNLVAGHFLYIDDLVTNEATRSMGYGDALFDWIVDYARSQNCAHLHLDSGVQRFGAHRFYLRKKMRISSHHFAMDLA